MPPKSRITREMILQAAYDLVRKQGADQLNARALAQRLGCSTQPVLYHFAHIEDIRREVRRMANEYHTAYLMAVDGDDPMLGIGLNYVRFGAEEKQLFRLLFQGDGLGTQTPTQQLDDPELVPVLQILAQEAHLTPDQAKTAFQTLSLLAHGYASMLANNSMEYDESEVAPILEMAFMGVIDVMQTNGGENQ